MHCNRDIATVRGFSDEIVCYLKGGDIWRGKSNEEKHLWHFVKKSGFKLLDLPAVGVRDALVVAVKETKVVSTELFHDCCYVTVTMHGLICS